MHATPSLHETDMLLRLCAAVVVGAVIGLNRDLRDRPAGVRTHALVGLGSAIVMVTAVDLPGDPVQAAALARAMQGVLTGIGFIGAGVILHQPDGRTVLGLTTAATIWVTAALGLACGLGRWMLVATGITLTLVVLLGGGPLERLTRRLMRRPETKPGES
ncbi:MAG: MgtC/SapB family protein [Gemmatimonadales bacterium]